MEIDGETVDEETGLRDFNRLTSDARVNYITEQIEYYGYSGERVKGLIFCSSKKEAVALSQIFNQRGYRTRALTGEDNQEKREEAIELLTRDISDPNEEHLDYILTVDIFNEGENQNRDLTPEEEMPAPEEEYYEDDQQYYEDDQQYYEDDQQYYDEPQYGAPVLASDEDEE